MTTSPPRRPTEADIALLAYAQQAELAAREGKTLNPNAWLAGPRGMAENFKKGGKVKAVRGRGDGVAKRGWTKGKMR